MQRVSPSRASPFHVFNMAPLRGGEGQDAAAARRHQSVPGYSGAAIYIYGIPSAVYSPYVRIYIILVLEG